MGARFDKWLARPSTLSALRQLVGPEQCAVRTKQHTWISPPTPCMRGYATAAASQWVPGPTMDKTTRNTASGPAQDESTSNAAADAALDTYREQRSRVAQELGLRTPEETDDGRISDTNGLVPSSTSYSDLLYSETRVRNVSSSRGLLVDKEENIGNLEAWANILQHRQRIGGRAGVVDVWHGMRQRGINLPVDGIHADTFWTTLLHAAIVKKPRTGHEELLEEVVRHAEDLVASGFGRYRALHTVLVGRFLRIAPYMARSGGKLRNEGPEYKWHKRLCALGFHETQCLVGLVEDAVKSSNAKTAFARWRRIYSDNEERRIYDSCMSSVFTHAADNAEIIVLWHKFLVSRGDMPGPEVAMSRTVQYLSSIDDAQKEASTDQHVDLKKLGQFMRADRNEAVQSISPLFSRASLNGLVGDVHGIKPKAISDQFCARMFATRTFSLETIIRGLAVLGTEVIGPMALRELAIRAASPEALQEKLAEVKEAGMQISPCVYGSILDQVAVNSHNDLFQALLDSDQHPENYEDRRTQETLFSRFLQDENWSMAYITLIGLSHGDHRASSRAWNRLLQHYTKARDHLEMNRVYNYMCSDQMIISCRSLNFMIKYLLPSRTPGKRPMSCPRSPAVFGNLVSTNLVVNAHVYAASQGQAVDPRQWIELLKRYGMTGRWETIEHLGPWLARHYAPQAAAPTRGRNRIYRAVSDTTIGPKVFNPVMLRAFVIWGFRHAGLRGKLQPRVMKASDTADGDDFTPQSWTRGLSLLQQLRHLGVKINTENVRRALREVLWPLFGPALSNRPGTVKIVQQNCLSLEEYVEHANEVWGELLFDVFSSKSLSGKYETTEARLLVAVFGRYRLADQKTGTWVDVEAWAAARDEGVFRYTSPTKRRREWTQSPFKFTDSISSRGKRQRANRRKQSDPPPVLTLPQHPPPVAQP